ncbi:hypothetical protein ACPESN_17605 [Stutzerimonas marianensis]|uniref:hypothetical protein n=1 Tax=Stutzerimonas marianensis TaxID=2929513 RepID=UPI003C2DF391
MNHRIKKLLGCAAIAALLAAGPNLNAKEGEMPKKMMMYYGGFEIEEMFDASQWFTRGMYRTRNIEADGGASNVTMLRSQPKPFTREQLSELPYAAAEAFDASHLDGVDTEALILNPPDLSHRIRYAYSAFAEPNKPEDYYYLYLDLAGRRFAVTFSRDGQTGDNLTGKAVKEISGDYASQAEHRKAFAEIDAFERKAR